MSFSSQASQTWLPILFDCPCYEGEDSPQVDDTKMPLIYANSYWISRSLLTVYCILQDESEQRRRDSITSFMTEILLALKEVYLLIVIEFHCRVYPIFFSILIYIAVNLPICPPWFSPIVVKWYQPVWWLAKWNVWKL